MKSKYLYVLLIVIGFYSCSNDPPEVLRQDKYFGSFSKNHSQISIENGPRQGFQYYFKGTEYSYRYITTTISNDSLVPFRLRISFSEEYKYLRDRNILIRLNKNDSIETIVQSREASQSIYLALALVNSFIIPCRQISFSKL
jgi:hypothetical protein